LDDYSKKIPGDGRRRLLQTSTSVDVCSILYHYQVLILHIVTVKFHLIGGLSWSSYWYTPGQTKNHIQNSLAQSDSEEWVSTSQQTLHPPPLPTSRYGPSREPE